MRQRWPGLFRRPRERAVRNGEWKTRCRILQDKTAALPQTLPGGREWWRCCRGKRGAYVYFTRENLNTEELSKQRDWKLPQSGNLAIWIVALQFWQLRRFWQFWQSSLILCLLSSSVLRFWRYRCSIGTYLFGYFGPM